MKKIITAITVAVMAFCLCPMAFAEEAMIEDAVVTNKAEMVSDDELTSSPDESINEPSAIDPELIIEEDEENTEEPEDDIDTEDSEEEAEEEDVEPAIWPAILVTISAAIAVVIVVILNLMG